eukprot:TRINITY_DN4924_c0_g1_i2.p1 TRINITY_DN4924_c0_g1~~TRINITY_DN4924_c0_g1_i2.p1  ORF type:complete len:235 (+),score=59.90 TRINITY_DN4924_c0_g1_i2:754-1458(+)
MKEEWSTATSFFLKALGEKHDNSDILTKLASCLISLSKWQEAGACATKAIQLDEKNFVAFLIRAQVHAHNSSWDEAIADYQSFLAGNEGFLTDLSAEALAIHNKQKSDVLERIGDSYMRKFFEEFEEIEQMVLKNRETPKVTKETKKPSTGAHQKNKPQSQAQTQQNTEKVVEFVDTEFIQDLKHRLEYAREENLLDAFKSYLEARTTCHEAKQTIDQRLLDLKEVVNTHLRNY